jgi:hypothetical protein
MQRMFAYGIGIPWPTMATICPNHEYASLVIHVFVNLFSPFICYFTYSINFKMIMKSNPMVNQRMLTKLLKFSSKSYASHGHLYQRSPNKVKILQNFIQYYINHPFITFGPNWNQFNPLGKCSIIVNMY